MQDPTHIYLNLDVVNNSTSKSQPLVFNETRNMPFLTNSQDYFCSVVRFTLQTSNSLPVFIPDILLGQDNVDTTVYAISMTLTKYTTDAGGTITSSTFGTSRYIEYNPLDLTQPEPAKPQTEVDLSSTYYFIYNINDWVDMINNTFDLLTKDIIQEFRDAGTTLSFKKPFIQYDISTGLFSICSDNAMDVIGSNGNYRLQIAFNSRLYNILPFSSTLNTFPPLGAPFPDTVYWLNLVNKSNANLTVLSSTGTSTDKYITLQTEFSPISIMNPIRNIYFTSNSLPVIPTLVSPPKILSDTNISTGSVSGDISNIIVDYSIPVSAQNNYNGEIIYAPQAEYRLLSMKEANNLNRIDLQAFWESKTGKAYPIYMPPGTCSNVKLLFRAVNFNINYFFKK
jgi:hypothetical protein